MKALEVRVQPHKNQWAAPLVCLLKQLMPTSLNAEASSHLSQQTQEFSCGAPAAAAAAVKYWFGYQCCVCACVCERNVLFSHLKINKKQQVL